MPKTVQELLGKIHPDDQEKANVHIKEHFDGLTEYYRAELRIKAKSGAWVWMGKLKSVMSTEWLQSLLV